MLEVVGEDADVNILFPTGAAEQPTNRQSVSVILFDSNPFLGSEFKGQTLFSNSSAYVAYRDADGKYLGENYLDGDIVFHYTNFDNFTLFTNITTCAYFDKADSYWYNDTCTT